jgi:alpha-L-rhamnosidase
MKANELFGAARWMTPGDRIDTPYIRGEFDVDKKVASARITICGLGFYELFINGMRIGDDLYGTLASDFHAYDNQPCAKLFGEKTSHRIYVNQHDITKELSRQNCLGVALAPGWYRNGHRYGSISNYGPVKLCFRIEILYEDGDRGEVLSGDWLKWTQSPIVSWNFYYGEHHDYDKYRLDGWNTVSYDMSNWNSLEETAAPDSEYYISDCPPDKIIRYIKPKLISETENEFIYDMGENITGTPILKSRIDGIQKLALRVSERLNPDGTIEEYTNHNQSSTFITDGSNRKYMLKFCWYGFRYAGVSKNAEIESCAVIHSDVPVTSSFKSDNALLNWLYETYLRTQLDNMHCGIPSDCPHIEKRGYTGDGQLVCEVAMMLLDSQKFYKKWIGDIFDCQDELSGHVQYTAPYVRSGGGPGGWGCAIAEVPYMYYKTFGDKSPLEESLRRTLRYFDYLEAHSENGLVVSDQKGEWCLGDWCTPEEIKIPEPFVNTYFYVKTINRLLEICGILQNTELPEKLEALSKEKKDAIIKKYYNPETGNFADNIQGANAFAIDIGLGDERTLHNIVTHYEKQTWYDTGIFGTDIVTRVLFEHGYEQLAYRLLTSKSKYSFHHWKSTGCTTFPEYWTYKRSQNHPMFGAVVKYLFSFLLGIRQEGAGYQNLVIEPKFVDGLDYAEGHITTVNGRIAVKYVKNNGNISIKAEIPEGINAKFKYGNDIYVLKSGLTELICNFN